MEEVQLLRDKSIEPTSNVIADALGSSNETYKKFIKEIANYDVEIDWRYYNDGKAWLGKGLYKWTTSRGTSKEKNTFWLSLWDGYFKVNIIIPERVRSEAINLSLTDETKKKIEVSNQFGKLKMFAVSFDVTSEKVFNDIFTLIEFRKKI